MPTYSISSNGYAMYGNAAFLRCDRCESEIHQFARPSPGCGNLYGITPEGVLTLVPEMKEIIEQHEKKCR